MKAAKQTCADIEIKNAIITSATLTSIDPGSLDSWIGLDYGGTCQGFGGYILYLSKSFTYHKLESIAGHFIFRCMEVADVTDWSKMKGKSVRVKIENGLISAIGHIIKEDWFCPKEDFAQSR